MVGTTGFEPATSRTPSVRATRLRYVPTVGQHRACGYAVVARLFRGGVAIRGGYSGPKTRNRSPRLKTRATAIRAYHSDSRAVNNERSESRKSSKVLRLSVARWGESGVWLVAADSPPASASLI